MENNLNCSFYWDLPYNYRCYFGGPKFNLEDPTIRKLWLKNLDRNDKDWIMPKQQHSSLVLSELVISDKLENFCDGLVSSNKNLGLAVFGSDCPGLIILTKNRFGIAHCGWRGLANGIVENLIIEISKQNNLDKKEIYAFIGPGICASCYEISDEMAEMECWPTESILLDSENHFHLNLSAVIKFKLNKIGITHVVNSNICTACSEDLHSFRKNGPGIVQVFALQNLDIN